MFPRALLAFLLSLLSGPAVPAQPEAPAKIAVIGASVSGGFEDGPMFGAEVEGDSLALQRLLRSAWREQPLRVSAALPAWMLAMFQDPEGHGKRQLDAVLRRQPDLVLAIDFPFWFGYVFRHGRDRESRLALQQECFELLDRVACTLVVGDYPDMTGAERRMLSPSQIPDAETLAELNARLRRWAAARKDTHVFPLSEFVARLRGDGYRVTLGEDRFELRAGDLLQGDKLHANRLGMALLGLELQRFLRRELPEDNRLEVPELDLAAWVKAAGAEPQVEAAGHRDKAGGKQRGR